MSTSKMLEIYASYTTYLHASCGLIICFQALDGFRVYDQSRFKATFITHCSYVYDSGWFLNHIYRLCNDSVGENEW